METDRFRQMESLFHAALEQPRGARPAFLRGKCNGDEELMRSIEQLLHQADRHDALPNLREDLDAPPTPSEAPGDRINGYRLVEPIGEGGFGTVYLAEQEHPVRRQVALKLIKLGMDTRQVIGRFETERDTLARMEHPGIARVLDAGVLPSGRPYFAMELVRGVDITTYCDQHKLDRRSRVELMARVCDAVQHAHQKGVIHRDLKPSNVLVQTQDGVATPRIIDFGIARAIDEPASATTRTMSGQLIGTPAYMSPEQAVQSHAADTRSDVYALGAMLYELVTGAPPFDIDSLATSNQGEIERILQVDEPMRPSARSPGIHRDLESIILKAMAKRPERRYASAAALAEDLRRYLRDESVIARPPRNIDRVMRFVRHHPALVASSTAIALVVVVAGTAIYASKRDASLSAQQTAAVNAFMGDVLSSMRPERHGVNVRLADVMTDASEHATRRFEGHPELEALSLALIGQVYVSIGMPQLAVEELEPAVEALQATIGPHDPRTLTASRNLVASYLQLHRLDDAEATLPTLLERHELEFGTEARETLIADLLRCRLLDARGKYEEVEHGWRALRKRMAVSLEPDDPYHGEVQARLATTLHRRWQRDGKQDDALLGEAETLLSGLVPSEPGPADGSPVAILAMNQLALILNDRGEWKDVAALTRRVLTHVIPRYGESHGTTAFAMAKLGEALFKLGEHEEAGAWMVRAVEGHRIGLSDAHPAVIAVMLNALPIVDASRHSEEGETYARIVRAQLPSVMHGNQELAIQSRFLIPHFISEQGRLDDAAALFAELEEEAKNAWPIRARAVYTLVLGQHLARQGELVRAAETLERARALFEEIGPPAPLHRGIWDAASAEAALAALQQGNEGSSPASTPREQGSQR